MQQGPGEIALLKLPHTVAKGLRQMEKKEEMSPAGLCREYGGMLEGSSAEHAGEQHTRSARLVAK